jgi:phosphatidylserine/phosphatidylglycerophosphate/cardiolipin synthase-like enzyme
MPLQLGRAARAAWRHLGAQGGATAELLADGDYLPALRQLLQSANRSIDLIQYNFYSESGPVAGVLADLLARKQAVPALEARCFLEGDHGDAAARNRATMQKLAAANITVQADAPSLVTHTKGACADDAVILSGSHNVTNTSLTRNNEVSVRIRSTVLGKAFRAYYDRLASAPDRLAPMRVTDGPVTMVTDTAYYTELLDVIDEATETLDISMYAFTALGLGGRPDPKAAAVLAALQAKGRAGVRIRLYLDQSADFRPDLTAANEAAARAFAGIPNVVVHFDPLSKITHAKLVIRDGVEALLGSTNWTGGDFDGRHQLNWRISDPGFVAALSAWYDRKFTTEFEPPVDLSS